METINFQYYTGDIKDSKPKGWVTLEQFYRAVKSPQPTTQHLLTEIAAARAAGDENRKAELKKLLPYVTPAVAVFGKRRIADVQTFTGIMPLDFDKIDNAQEFKEYLFNEYHWIMAAWLSASGRGVRAFVRIPIITVIDPMESRLEYWAYFYGAAADLYQYNGFDEAPKNCVLPLFVSHDPDILIRRDAITMTDKGERLGAMPTNEGARPQITSPTNESEQRIFTMIQSGLNHITDNGHPQLRALCLAIGGYIGAGYADLDKVLQYIKDSIRYHGYLKKDVLNYQKTAQWAIHAGQNKPIYLN